MTGTSTEFGGVTAMSYGGQKWCELYGVYRDDSTQKQGEFKLFKMEIVSQENGKLIKGELGHILGRVRKLRSL